MQKSKQILQVAVLGAGHFANKTHIPNLLKIENVNILAICDINFDSARKTSAEFCIPHCFQSADKMLEDLEFDILFSVIPAHMRTNTEILAAKKGIHLFIEKPQAIDFQIAVQIDNAIKENDVLSTVGFRERYRPIFQIAKRKLENKKIVHIEFALYQNLPKKKIDGTLLNWRYRMETGGFPAFDWGGHAIDLVRYVSGLNPKKVQAFFVNNQKYETPLSCCFQYAFSTGATLTTNFISSTPHSPFVNTRCPISQRIGGVFRIFYEGGYMIIHGYDHIEMNREIVYESEPSDPWLSQCQTFINAVQLESSKELKNDYYDGLFSLAPVLVGWESANTGGKLMDIELFMKKFI